MLAIASSPAPPIANADGSLKVAADADVEEPAGVGVSGAAAGIVEELATGWTGAAGVDGTEVWAGVDGALMGVEAELEAAAAGLGLGLISH